MKFCTIFVNKNGLVGNGDQIKLEGCRSSVNSDLAHEKLNIICPFTTLLNKISFILQNASYILYKTYVIEIMNKSELISRVNLDKFLLLLFNKNLATLFSLRGNYTHSVRLGI